MTMGDVELRLAAIEGELHELKARLAASPGGAPRSWLEGAGAFENDPVFDEIARLGREYRESLRPAKRRQKVRK